MKPPKLYCSASALNFCAAKGRCIILISYHWSQEIILNLCSRYEMFLNELWRNSFHWLESRPAVEAFIEQNEGMEGLHWSNIWLVFDLHDCGCDSDARNVFCIKYWRALDVKWWNCLLTHASFCQKPLKMEARSVELMQ